MASRCRPDALESRRWLALGNGGNRMENLRRGSPGCAIFSPGIQNADPSGRAGNPAQDILRRSAETFSERSLSARPQAMASHAGDGAHPKGLADGFIGGDLMPRNATGGTCLA